MSQKTSRLFVAICTIVIFGCLGFILFAISNSGAGQASPHQHTTPTATTFIADGGITATPTATATAIPTPIPAVAVAGSTTVYIPVATSAYQTPTSTRKSVQHKPTSVPTTIPTATPMPTSTPTLAPIPTPTVAPTPVPAVPTGVNGNPWGFDFSPGAPIYGRYIPSAFCLYFSCIPSFWSDGTATSYVVECVDGMYSRSGGLRGSCSRHGGDAAILYSHSS